MSIGREQLSTDALTERAPDGQQHPPGCVLYVLDGDARDVRRYHTLRRGTAFVGASPRCDFVLHDPKVSRRHLEVTVVAGGVGVRDLGSTNGTRVMGVPLTGAVVAIGTHVRIGQTTMVLLPIDTSEAVAPIDDERYGQLLGRSLSMRRVFALLRRLEEAAVPVLVTGETGTGKELVARALHEHGPHRGGPFVVLDCASIPPGLIESEIFGHARGAFTGATCERPGIVEQAHGGTLFLDEIGDLPPELQTRLLRVLDRQEVKRVGENHYRSVKVRVVAATHRDLAALVREGGFREDLYYRLSVVTVQVPALRDRPDDIAMLAQAFAAELGVTEPLDRATIASLSQHNWPGNVRELRAAVQRLVTLGTWVPSVVGGPAPAEQSDEISGPYHEAKERLLGRFEEGYVRALLERHQGNVSAAAREAGVSRKHLRELICKHGLRGQGS